MAIELTGIDLSNPQPGTKREIAFAQGSSGGLTRARDVVILCNKIASIGSGSVDGRGDALNTPTAIFNGEAEIIERYGYKSEALLLHKAFTRVNKTAQVWMLVVPPGSGSASVDFTFATAATGATAVIVDFLGEQEQVAVANADAIATIATAVAAKINAKLDWPITASAALGVVTVTAAVAGSRFDHYLNQIRMRFTKTAGTTVTKGNVTAGSTDDDQTTAISTLENYSIYYQVNPKQITSAPTSTDNGIGEHLASLATQVAPTVGKAGVLIAGNTGTVSQASAVAVGMNKEFSHLFWAENSDWSPGMIAAHMAGIVQAKQATNPAANLAGYGSKSADTLYVPDPYAKTDRATSAELTTALNNGVSPIEFSSTGKPKLTWLITTKSQTDSDADYRARPGHIPSVMFYAWEILRNLWNSEAQPNVANDPADGEQRLAGFTYPGDVKKMVSRMIDYCIDGGGVPTLLDPSQKQAMKDSIVVERLTSGVACRVELSAVRHLLKGHFKLLETSPSI